MSLSGRWRDPAFPDREWEIIGYVDRGPDLRTIERERCPVCRRTHPRHVFRLRHWKTGEEVDGVGAECARNMSREVGEPRTLWAKKQRALARARELAERLLVEEEEKVRRAQQAQWRCEGWATTSFGFEKEVLHHSPRGARSYVRIRRTPARFWRAYLYTGPGLEQPISPPAPHVLEAQEGACTYLYGDGWRFETTAEDRAGQQRAWENINDVVSTAVADSLSSAEIKLMETIACVQELIRRPGTDGERVAAVAALARLEGTLLEKRATRKAAVAAEKLAAEQARQAHMWIMHAIQLHKQISRVWAHSLRRKSVCCPPGAPRAKFLVLRSIRRMIKTPQQRQRETEERTRQHLREQRLRNAQTVMERVAKEPTKFLLQWVYRNAFSGLSVESQKFVRGQKDAYWSYSAPQQKWAWDLYQRHKGPPEISFDDLHAVGFIPDRL